MLSFMNRPKSVNHDVAITVIAVDEEGTLATKTPALDLVQIREDLDTAIIELEKKTRYPELSVQNLGTAVINGTAVVNELATAIMNPNDVVQSATDPLNMVKSIGVGFGLVFSGASQFNKYWQRQQKAAEMTEALIRGIDPEIVNECFYESEDKNSKQKIKTRLDGVYNSERLIKAMAEHGAVSILLKDGLTTITLKNITMLNKKTAIALVGALISPMVYSSVQLLDYLHPEQAVENSTFAHASVILATGVPFTDVWNTIEAICYGQERNILEATRLIIVNFYKDNIYMVPEKLLSVLANFVKHEVVTKLREAKEEVLSGQGDIEANKQLVKLTLRG